MAEQTTPIRGANVYALRTLLRLTQKALAERGGIERTEVVEIEHGRNQATSARIVGALATGFGLTMEQTVKLLDGALSPADAYRARKV